MKPCLFVLVLLAAVNTSLVAQPTRQTTISPAERKLTIDATLKLLNDEYVFPDVAKQMEQHVRTRLRTYETITDGHKLAGQLTSDLRVVSHDKHLHIQFQPDGVADGQLWKRDPTPAERAADQPLLRRSLLFSNFGIRELSVLKGNLGYISFDYLAPPDIAGASYTAAMNYLAQTDALIIDLRECQGAISEYAIPFLCSYFFAEPTHLNDFYRSGGPVASRQPHGAVVELRSRIGTALRSETHLRPDGPGDVFGSRGTGL